MKIIAIHKGRNTDYGHPKLDLRVYDPHSDLYGWLEQTFGDSEIKAFWMYGQDQNSWTRTWFGKRSDTRHEQSFQLVGSEIVSMFLLKWS
jgi:hypothetical protein